MLSEAERLIKIYGVAINKLEKELQLEKDYEEKQIIAGKIFCLEDEIEKLKKVI